MATLRVNLTEIGNACGQDATVPGTWPHAGWYVFLCDCKGNVFSHAGKEYGPYPVDHGYLEIRDVPKGRYLLFAIVNPFPILSAGPDGLEVWQANFASHYAVVDVCCEDACRDICVTLYNSGWHYCVRVIIHWFDLLVKAKKLDAKVAANAKDALNEALRHAGDPRPTDAIAIKQLKKITSTFLEMKPEQTKK